MASASFPSGSADPAAHDSQPRIRLDGWKAIAAYLGRDIRTAQRWEQSERLPVHRLEHKQRASAYAFTDELAAWMAARTTEAAAAGTLPELLTADERIPESGPRAAEHVSRHAWTRQPVVLLAGILVAVVIAGTWVAYGRWGTPRQDGDTSDGRAFAAFAEGRALYLSRRYADAAVSLERAVTRDPNYGVAWAWLAKTYGRLAQPVWAGGAKAADRANEAASRAVALAPTSPDAQIALALAARAAGQVEGLRARAQRAIDLDPRAAEALALLGDSYSAVVYACHASQDPEKAEEYYRRSMELLPDLTTTASNRAGNLRRMGRYSECVEFLNRFMRTYSDEPPLRGVRGACRMMLGDLDGAAEDILPLRNNPKMATAGSLVYLGMLGIKSGRVEEGVHDLEAFAQYDRSARTDLITAEAYGLVGDTDRAAAHLRRAFDADRACPSLVASSIAFAPIRDTPQVQRLLATYSASGVQALK